MGFETDAEALERVLESDGQNVLVVKGESSDALLGRERIYNAFLIYMRINTDGTFFSKQLLYVGDQQNPIGADVATNPAQGNTLGWYAQDMAYCARKGLVRHGGQKDYVEWGDGLDEMKFPPYVSYVILFMDDLHWPYLEDDQHKPVVPFYKKKGKFHYHKHNHAFSKPIKFPVTMPNDSTGVPDERHALVMTNRMRNGRDVLLRDKEKETYCFDLNMRVSCAKAGKRLTIIIDPTGENLGPPQPPY